MFCFRYIAKRLAGKNVSSMIHFVSAGCKLSIQSVSTVYHSYLEDTVSFWVRLSLLLSVVDRVANGYLVTSLPLALLELTNRAASGACSMIFDISLLVPSQRSYFIYKRA